jgi:hypothetical protein
MSSPVIISRGQKNVALEPPNELAGSAQANESAINWPAHEQNSLSLCSISAGATNSVCVEVVQVPP